MSILNDKAALLRRYRDNQKGNVVILFGLTLLLLAGLTGAAVDYTIASNVQKRSQSISDALALNAAIFIKNHGRPPVNDQEGLLDGKEYSAADLGYEFDSFVKGGSDNIKFKVVYDDSSKETVVTVIGAVVPTFTSVFGREKTDISALSTVSYIDTEDQFPASITLVLDNSGSMKWDDKPAENQYYDSDVEQYDWVGHWQGDSPEDAQERIAGLETSVLNFQSDLKKRISETNDAGQRMIRTGLLPYSSEILTTGQVDMRWGYVPNGKITSMSPSGSTNSNPPMAEAKDWLDLENSIHQDEADRVGEDYKEPLKFVIFMTDGQNTVGNFEFVADDESSRYYAYKSLFGQPAQWWYSGDEPYDGDFREGWLRRDTDRLTIETCQDMHDEDVNVYTIGYALEVDRYNANDENYPKAVKEVTYEVSAAANALLSACASESENFILAENAEELDQAFDRIQNAIAEELIRLKS